MSDWVGSVHAVLAARLPMSIAETEAFSDQAREILTDQEVARLKIDLAVNPNRGVVISGTGGIRKHRCSYGGKGKSGGARVIFYFHDRQIPIYLLAIYKKSEKLDLSEMEKALMKKLVREFVAAQKAKNRPQMIS